eukprot:RCo028432
MAMLFCSYIDECRAWGVPNIFRSMSPVLTGVFHSNDRYRYPDDHPFRTGLFRRYLAAFRIIDNPKKRSAWVDVAEDLTHVVVASGILAKFSSVWTEGSTGHFFYGIHHTPFWASALLTRVRFWRIFGQLSALGTLYFGTYNFLTGALGWPVTKYGEFHCAASCVAFAPVAAAAALTGQPKQLRASVPLFSRFGRFYLLWAMGSFVAAWYNSAIKNANDGSNVPFARRYVDHIRNAPGYEIVAQLPHIPAYKAASSMGNTHMTNPFYNEDEHRRMLAQAHQVLSKYQL